MRNSERRWTRHLRRWVTAAATAMVLTATLTGAVAASPETESDFDLDTGNALTEVIYPPFQKAVRTDTPRGDDATLVADHILTVEVSWFDAIAPYHPTAVGIYSDLGRRPRSEDTIRNKNTAVIYAAYTSLMATFPQFKSEFREMVRSAGLDPDNREENTTTAPGIGNLAAKKVMEARKNDGSNRDGMMGNRKYNPQPYADYTGYEPVNSGSELRNPSRWQPRVVSEAGLFKVQKFATPQYGRVTPISYDKPTEFSVAPPTNSDHHNRDAYKKQADEILDVSANLTDVQKMKAEHFNDKIFALGFTAGTAAFEQHDFDVEDAVHYVATVDISIVDVTIVTWHYKRKYDSVRPFSAIRYLYGDEKLTAWGGPGKGTVDDITGNEWRGYLQAADHTEYPSASSAFCMAYAQAARRFLGTDKIDITVSRKKGSSWTEPGVTPAKDISLHWDNWTDYANDCRTSRIWAGVHFRSSTEAVESYAPQVGDSVYNFIQGKLKGN